MIEKVGGERHVAEPDRLRRESRTMATAVLLGAGADDTEQDVDYLAAKTINLRIFEDDQQNMNRSLLEVDGALLVTSGEVEAGGGSGVLRATIPLGPWPRPAWMWPEALDGPVRLTVDGRNVDSDVVAALLGIEEPPATATGVLTVNAVWHPERPDDTRVLVEIEDYTHSVGHCQRCATVIEPLVDEDASGHLRMNIDKGNQATEGRDMINLGHVAHPELGDSMGDEFKIKSLTNEERSFEVTTDADGALWLIVGTDSGFEGLTTLYYDRIAIVLSEVSEE